MSKPLVLYDTISELKDGEDASFRAESPNVWRVRYALNIKGIDYRTEWVDIADLQDRLQKLGVPPTGQLNGKPLYTVPTLVISDTEAVTDSQTIIDYLEKAYPSTPTLFPPGTRALQKAFVNTHYPLLETSVFFLVASRLFGVCSSRGKEYMRRVREPLFGGVPYEEVELKGEARVEAIDAIVKRLGQIADAIGEDELLLAGSTDAPSNADVNLAAVLNWVRRLNGVEGDVWKAVVEADGGRWARYMKVFEKFQKVV